MGRLSTALVVLLFASVAHADGDDSLTIGVIGFGSWPEAVASVQGDTTAEGRVLQVTVRDGANAVACGTYTLVLDAIASQAFSVEGCDPSTGATTIRLVHRTALFAHDDVVPRPLIAGISAVLVRRGGSAGGAQNVGGSELRCSVAVRPYLQDLEHGTRVYLAPGRFVLRSVAANVSVEPQSDGWTLRGSVEGGLSVDYEVYDSLRSTVVVRDRATLECGTRPIDSVAPGTVIVQSDPLGNAGLRGATFQSVAPLRASPGAAIYASIVMPSVVYLPVANVAFRNGDVVAQGTDLAVADSWMAASGFGIVSELRYALFALRADAAFSDHMFMLDARTTVAVGGHGGGAFWYIGAQAHAWDAWLHGVGQGTWETGLNAALGVEAGVRIPTSVHWDEQSHRFRLGELAIALSAPVLGEGAWFVTWEGAWGTGR